MESGLKRFWTRKKSFSTADQPANSRQLSISNSIISRSGAIASNLKDGRPSMTSTRQVNRSFDQENSKKSQDISSIDNEDFTRTKSGHRIQPMLVGISRPGTAKDRPDTAGSLQDAVQRAGDSIHRRPSNVSTNHAIPTKSSSSSRAPSRHVDIFSVAAAKPSSLSQYNEEIAERNIDTYRLALENTPYVYNPTSKYQEEVAIRNAYLPYKSRPSTDSIRRSSDHDRTASMTNRSIRSVVSQQPNGTYSRHTPTNSGSSNMRSLQDMAPHHIRQLSARSRDEAQVPVSPSQHHEQDEVTKSVGLNIGSQALYSPARSVGGGHGSREARMSTIQEGLPYQIRTYSVTRTPTLRDSGHSSNTFIDYKVSSMEYGNQPITDRIYTVQTGSNVPYSPPSTYNISSSVRKQIVLPKRTIMDLTNDDPDMFSEASSAFGYSQYSPIIEQAKSDAFRRVEPSQIHTEERRASKTSGDMFQSSTPLATIMNTEYVPPHYTVVETETRDQPTFLSEHSHVENRLPNPIAFSPISTVASWSPRSSAHVINSSELLSMDDRLQAAIETSRAIARETTSNIIAREATSNSIAKRDSGGSIVKERVASYEGSAEKNNAPPSSAIETTNRPFSVTPTPTSRAPSTYYTQVVEGGTTMPPAVQLGKRVEVVPSHVLPVEASEVQKKMARSDEEKYAKTPAAKQGDKATLAPIVYTSPTALQAIDNTRSSDTFGIRTRDFAISPRKETMPNIEKVAPPVIVIQQTPTPPKSEQKPNPKKSRVSKPNTPTPKPVDTAFDEEAFARKRADARAALEKLQRSLSEDFLTLPDRATLKGKQNVVESLPATPAPAAIVTESTIAYSNSSSQRPEAERMPPSSFRSSREMQQRSSREMQQRTSREMSQRSSKDMQQRTSREIQQRTSIVSNRSLSTGSRSSRRGSALSALRNVEPAINPIDQNVLSPQLLHAIQTSSRPPKSPGEISLSSFPVPSSSRPPSQPDALPGLQLYNNSITSVMKRRSSTKSQGSTASGFDIPLHMVPGRTSSVRDPVPEEVDSAWA